MQIEEQALTILHLKQCFLLFWGIMASFTKIMLAMLPLPGKIHIVILRKILGLFKLPNLDYDLKVKT